MTYKIVNTPRADEDMVKLATQQTVDIGEYIRKHPHLQYNKYLNPKQFASFKIENGNIVWGEDWDLIFPIEQLHQGVIG